MSIPTEVKEQIYELVTDLIADYDIVLDDTETNGIMAYLIEGDNYHIENDKIYLSLYSILKYWRDNKIP